MSSIIVIGTLWLILAVIVVMLFLKFWKSVSEFFVFTKNPQQFLKDLYKLTSEYTASLPVPDLDEISLLSNNSNQVQKAMLRSDLTAGYIRNIYQENLAVFVFREIGVNRKLMVFADKSGIFAFQELAGGNYKVYDENASLLGEFNSRLEFIWKNTAIAKLQRDTDGRNTAIIIGEKQQAALAKYDPVSKVPQRHFSFIESDEITRDTSFRILMYASLIDYIRPS